MLSTLNLRNFDKNVGGGVDRDKLPASDFAGKNRSFPIKSPKDVKDALRSIGRAGSGNYSAEKLKANILRIAKRKGFPIPKSDQKEKVASVSPFVAQIELATAIAGQPRTSWVWFCAVRPELYDPRYGAFAITKADLAQMYENFTTGKFPVSPTRLPVDYNHGTSRPQTAEEGKAAGWITNLQLRADGSELWALVEWTDEAAKRIEAKEYQYISPTFSFEYTTSTGAEDIGVTLLAGAICNRPVIHGQPAVSLAQQDAVLFLAESDEDEEAEQLFSFDDQKRRIYAALKEEAPECPDCGMSSDAPDGYSGPRLSDVYDDYVILRCWCGALSQLNYQIATDGDVTFDGEPFEVRVTYEPLTPEGEEQQMATMKVKDAKGQEIELAQETVDAIVKAYAKPEGAVELAALKATVETQGHTIKELADKNAALELAARTREAEAKFDGFLRAGKVDPKEKDALMALALKDAATFDALMAVRPVIRELNVETGSGNDHTQSTAKAQLDLAIADIRKAEPKLTAQQAYAKALEQHPELYGELVQ